MCPQSHVLCTPPRGPSPSSPQFLVTRGYGPHQEPILLGHTQLLPVPFDLLSPPKKGLSPGPPYLDLTASLAPKFCQLLTYGVFYLVWTLNHPLIRRVHFKNLELTSKFDQKDFFEHKKILNSISVLGCKATLHCSQPLGRFAYCRLWNAMMVRGLMLKKSADIFKIVAIKLDQTYLAAFHV